MADSHHQVATTERQQSLLPSLSQHTLTHTKFQGSALTNSADLSPDMANSYVDSTTSSLPTSGGAPFETTNQAAACQGSNTSSSSNNNNNNNNNQHLNSQPPTLVPIVNGGTGATPHLDTNPNGGPQARYFRSPAAETASSSTVPTTQSEFNVPPIKNATVSLKQPTTTKTTITMATPSTTAIPCQQKPLQHQQQQQPQASFVAPQISPCDIKSLFECPICFDYVVPPIYQCQNGHLVCQNCSCKITNCPTCRVTISGPAIRNLQLDRLANTFQYPCKFNFNGCNWKSYWFKKREHEENCDFISYTCPCPGTTCKWTGLLSEVMAHLGEHHKSITTLRGEDIVFLATDINLKGAVDWVMIQSCFNQHFLLVLEKQELKTGQQKFFAVVQLIGSQKEAEKFKYKLELSRSVSGQTKRLQWEATPRSISDGIQVAISTYDCLVFDARTAQHFLSPIQKDKEGLNMANNDGNQGENLGINVTIERVI